MKYFIISVDNNYVAPSPLRWQGILDRKTLHEKKSFQIPEHLLFSVENHMQMMYTDIIVFPCFMVSEMVMNVIKKYNPFIKFVRILFYDQEEKRSMIYYLPFLNKMTGLNCKGNGELVLNRSEWKDRVIGEVEDNKNKLHIVVRMDLAESILRRNAIGVGLAEIEAK
ncbi:MAG: hypothetical protein K2P64_13860 [Lachnospiraceae bacterium]|nr:hypothetical protein [Lachnospiraceae bacterium]